MKRVEDVLAAMRARGYRTSAEVKSAARALLQLESKKMADQEAALQLATRSEAATHQHRQQRVERNQQAQAKAEAMAVVEQDARARALLAVQEQAEQLRAEQEQQLRAQELERRA